MKKILFFTALAMLSLGARAQGITQLPNPNKNAEMSLFSALQQRRSVREYMLKEIDNNTLSQVLWAACGVNRPESGKITAPSARNVQDILLYVVKADGAYLYNPAMNTLTQVSKKDLRKSVASRQEDVATAPVMLVLVSDQSKFGKSGDMDKTFGAMDAGYVSQNIYLACTALGLGTVARATMDEQVLKKELNLNDSQILELNHPIGWDKTPAKTEKLPFHLEVVGNAPQTQSPVTEQPAQQQTKP